MFGGIDWDVQKLLAVAPFAFLTIATIFFFIHKMWKVSADNALKQSMVERGMSADDIERVMQCGNEDELSPSGQYKTTRHG